MTQTLWETVTIPLTPEPNSAMPTCTINSSECSYLASSSISFTDAQSASLNAGLDVTLSTPSLACNYTGPTTISNPTTISPSCTATAFSQAQGGTVAYWPVTQTGNYLCGNGTTITPNATVSTPRIASTYGTTIASPGVLLSIDTLYAHDPCGRRVGTGLSNIVLTQQTSQISSQCAPLYHQGGNAGTQVNFADYNSPVPYSAYACLPQCNGGSSAFGTTDLCSTIYDGDFKPILALPTDIVSLQPEWANCIFGDVYDGMNTIWDPPQALVAANTEAGVTVPVAKTTSASPASAPAQPTRQPTTTPSAAADMDPSASPSAASPGQGSSSSGQGIGGAIASGLGMTKSFAAASSDQTPGSSDGSDSPNGGNDVNMGSEGSSNNSGNGGDGSSGPSPTAPSEGGSSDSPGSAGGSDGGAGNDSNGSGTGGGSENDAPSSGTQTAGPGTGDSPGSNDPGSNAGGGLGSSDSGSGNPSALAVDLATSLNPPAIATVGSDTLRVDTGNTANVLVAGTTLTPGQGTIINNTPISVAAGSVVIGSYTVAIPTAQRNANAGTGALLTLGDSTITAAAADSSGAISIAGQTILAGQTATIDGHTVVADPSGVVLDGSNVALSSMGDSSATSGVLLTAGSSTITAVPAGDGAIVVGGNTLTPGQAKVINGHTISDASGSVVLDGSSTMGFSQSAATETVISAGSDVLTVTELPSDVVVVDGHTLSPGGPGFTIDGHFVSDGSSGAVVVSGTPAPGTGSSTGSAQPSASKKGDASSSRLHLQISAATVVVGLLHLVFFL
ncbi:hypothetical protein PRZ48_009066 [Zasmidium cellare]|uniref:Uncharacterized protein n=1 Tax=Zasmidium cellare TaxID=395010 RepID=A0ABR0EHB4_ZASCE|nr:hypothetical protein PRZ48_009066 [Zasmidium cellare]